MAEADGQDSSIEEPEAFAYLVRHPKLTDEEAGWLIRDRDEAVVAAARREVLEVCIRAMCWDCDRVAKCQPDGLPSTETAYQGHPGGDWCHDHYNDRRTWWATTRCHATRIRRLAAERGWLAPDEGAGEER